MTKEINYPELTTWFICWSNEREVLKAYGVVLPSQTMSTFWDVIDTYTDEDTWNKELKDNGIQVKKINNVDTNE
jgi:hypothetical protein